MSGSVCEQTGRGYSVERIVDTDSWRVCVVARGCMRQAATSFCSSAGDRARQADGERNAGAVGCDVCAACELEHEGGACAGGQKEEGEGRQ